jgi:hypothetical protein
VFFSVGVLKCPEIPSALFFQFLLSVNLTDPR